MRTNAVFLDKVSGVKILCSWCWERESNPHERKAHSALNAARLPVPSPQLYVYYTTKAHTYSAGFFFLCPLSALQPQRAKSRSLLVAEATAKPQDLLYTISHYNTDVKFCGLTPFR